MSINPDIDVETHATFYLPDSHQGFIAHSGADYVVDAVDTMSAKIAIIDEAYHSGIPVVSSMGAGNKLHPEYFQLDYIENHAPGIEEAPDTPHQSGLFDGSPA